MVRFYSKALVGAKLNWSVREKECYGIFYGVRLFEDLLDNQPFILKTDHMNLTYLNVTLTGKVLSWKLCHVPGKEVHQGVPDALSRLHTKETRNRKGKDSNPVSPATKATYPLRAYMSKLQRCTTPVWGTGAKQNANEL